MFITRKSKSQFEMIKNLCIGRRKLYQYPIKLLKLISHCLHRQIFLPLAKFSCVKIAVSIIKIANYWRNISKISNSKITSYRHFWSFFHQTELRCNNNPAHNSYVALVSTINSSSWNLWIKAVTQPSLMKVPIGVIIQSKSTGIWYYRESTCMHACLAVLMATLLHIL